MVKGITNLYTDKGKVKMAKEKGINLSKLFDQALDQAINNSGTIDFDRNDPILLKSIDIVKENPRFFYGRVKLLNNSGINITTSQFEKLIKERVNNDIEPRGVRTSSKIRKSEEPSRSISETKRDQEKARRDIESSEDQDR